MDRACDERGGLLRAVLGKKRKGKRIEDLKKEFEKKWCDEMKRRDAIES